MVASSWAVTFTLIVFAPTESGAWKPFLFASASVSAVSLAFRYATVAWISFTVGRTVISSTLLITDAV